MTDSFVQITSFASAVEAEQARLFLKQNGIAAFVDGANAGTMLSYFGTALGGVRLLVREADARRAAEIIGSQTGVSDADGDAWFCGQCHERVDAGFNVCWSCGKDRKEVEQPFPPADAEVLPETLDEEEDSVEEEEDDSPVVFDPNPYASPRTPSEATEPTPDKEVKIDPDAEAMVLRAWRASIIGLVIAPLLAHLYSMILLIRASTLGGEFSPAGNRRYYLALAINVFVVCLAVFAFAMMSW